MSLVVQFHAAVFSVLSRAFGMVVFLAASLLWPRADMVFLQFVFCLRVLLDPTLAVAPLGMSDVSC